MSPRMLKYLIGFCMIAALMCFMACPPIQSFRSTEKASSFSFWASNKIQTKAVVFDLQQQDGFTKVGVMAAYDPQSHAFWWRPTPMIAEPSMLERYYERCPFARNGNDLLNFCVRGNEVVVSATDEKAPSLDAGIERAESNLRSNQNLLMSYHSRRDNSFDLQKTAGVDMNTAQGVPPTTVKSIHKTNTGWQLNVTCGCGNALISLNEQFGFAGFKHI